MWHILVHVVIGVLIQTQRKDTVPVSKPPTVADELKSQVKHLKKVLASGSKMRQQTPVERDANPTTFGYARFPLTEKEREDIERKVAAIEETIRRIKSKSR